MLNSQQSKIYFIYILECRDSRLYTGITTDLQRRIGEHQARSKKSKFTRAFPINKVAAYWRLESSLANILKIERAIKKLHKSEKEALIAAPMQLGDVLEGLGLSYESRVGR